MVGDEFSSVETRKRRYEVIALHRAHQQFVLIVSREIFAPFYKISKPTHEAICFLDVDVGPEDRRLH